MSEFLARFVEAGQRLAVANGLAWNIGDNASGKAAKSERWNLTALAGQVPPPALWLTGFEFTEAEIAALKETMPSDHPPSSLRSGMIAAWADLCKSVILDEIIVKKNKPQHALVNVFRPLRILALCAQDTGPTNVTPDQVKLAYNVAMRFGASGKVASNLKMAVRNQLDVRHIANHLPLHRYCTPYATAEAVSQHAAVEILENRSNGYRRTDRQRKELSDRKAADRLPDEEAFWELVRIIYTERPKTFSDALRFEQIKLTIATGMRIGETVLIPEDCLLWTEHLDPMARPAETHGGIVRSLSLRYFAEKQPDDEKPSGVYLYESLQHVPALLTDMTVEAIERSKALTAPMRIRLRQQVATGRIFPEFDECDLVPAWDMYTRLSGSIQIARHALPEDLAERYRSSYDNNVLDEIRELQVSQRFRHGLSDNVAKYWAKFCKATGVEMVDAKNRPFRGNTPWLEAFVNVKAVEAAVQKFMATKLSDTTPFPLMNGSMSPARFLFLMPIRSLIDGRNGGIVDVKRYAFVGRASATDIQQMLAGGDNGLFTRYAKGLESRGMKMVTHSIRHLQNAELFRVGVSDAIITKRFGRRDIAQSHAYDHRSLAEDLAHIDLPEAATSLGDRTKELAKLIVARRVSGPIIDEFLEIQASKGDQAAFEYLEAEADGLHVTPYGLCVNSFVVDPCPKHLECFNGCRHLTRTKVTSERDNLQKLLDISIRVESSIQATPESHRNVGWENQLHSIATRVGNIKIALNTEPDNKPFPDGPDLFRSVEPASQGSILDAQSGRDSGK
jgi:hypothetical protein